MGRDKQPVTMDLLASGVFGGNHARKEVGLNGLFHNHRGGAFPFVDMKKDTCDQRVIDGVLFGNTAFAGARHQNMEKKPLPMEHMMMPYRNCGERFLEQSAENFPDGHIPHMAQRKLGMDTPVENFAASRDISSSLGGRIGIPNKLDVGIFGGAVSQQESRMHLAAPNEKKQNSQLTIFYGGNVNVFNDISPEQANKIMLLASSANPKYGLIDVSNLVPSTDIICALPQSTNQVANLAHFAYPNTSSPSRPLPEGQFEVTRVAALPQARKASLARFFEKRRERVLSKSPYLLAQESSSFMEERHSSSNDASMFKKTGHKEDNKENSPQKGGHGGDI